MASGKTHNTVTVAATVFNTLAGARFLSWEHTLSLAFGTLLGLVLTPDWDVDRGSRANYHVRRVAKVDLLSVLIKPYATAYKHRSFFTHTPIISTLWRLLYLLVPFIVLPTKNQPTALLALLVGCLISFVALSIPLWFLLWFFWFYITIYWEFMALAILGLMVSDILHYIFDLF